MKPILARPTWDDIHKGTLLTLAQIQQQHKNFTAPDYILAPMRGGMVPSIILSHAMNNVPIIPIHYSSKDGRGDNKNHSNVFPEIPPTKHKLSPILLLSEDIVDSGNSMKEIYEHYIIDYSVLTITLYYKEGAAFLPHAYWQRIPKDAPFIVFPWET